MIEYSKSDVDAIEDGKIVRVSEDYAKREGLLILRKSFHELKKDSALKKDDERKNKGFIGMEDLRKPLNSKNNEILRELVENFHWTLIQKRKGTQMTRKKLAEALGESEVNIKMIENGVLPANNFILINKLERFYGIILRKNKVADAGGKTLRQVIDFNSKSNESGVKIPSWARKEDKKEETGAEIKITKYNGGGSTSDDSAIEIVDLGDDKGSEQSL
ncbi:hypothetical protein J4229_00545 [Candidatus Pacearchaeota archaeon]|nr:hypothetical protein [Candidatus Pacearchaeota archaeon]